MPAPLDLTGRRFGKLVALRRDRWHDGKTAWQCRCDCGAETLVPLNRLNLPDDDPRAIRACEACRSRRCVVCGAPYLRSGSGKTCGKEECRKEVRRATNAAAEARAEQRAPGYKIGRQREWRRRMRKERPDLYEAYLERDREHHRRRRAQMDELDRAIAKAYAREYYAKNRDAIRARWRRWLDSLPPARREEWDERMRQAATRYRQRKALSQMMRQGAQMVERMENDDDE